MRKIFLDTNVVLDLLLCREPFYGDAVKIFSDAHKGKYELYVSVISFATAAYVMRKQPVDVVKALMRDLRTLTHIAISTDFVIDNALASKFDDIEDAIQNFSAEASFVDCILTRNINDFTNSSVPVYSPNEFLLKQSLS